MSNCKKVITLLISIILLSLCALSISVYFSYNRQSEVNFDSSAVNVDLESFFQVSNIRKPDDVQIYKLFKDKNNILPINTEKALVYSTSFAVESMNIDNLDRPSRTWARLQRGDIFKLPIGDTQMLKLNDEQTKILGKDYIKKYYVVVVPVKGRDRLLGVYALIYNKNVIMTDEYLGSIAPITELIKRHLQ